MKVTRININQFLNDFQKEYQFLYDNQDQIIGYKEAVEAFDCFIENDNHKQFIYDFVSYRKDFISSDREAAAFMFTLEKYM